MAKHKNQNDGFNARGSTREKSFMSYESDHPVILFEQHLIDSYFQSTSDRKIVGKGTTLWAR